MFTSVVDNDPVSKKIKTALRDLVDALEKHAAVTAERPSSSKRAGRATAKVRTAAAAYTAIVADKTGQPNPFVDFLDEETVISLRAERDAVARKHGEKRSGSASAGSPEPSSGKKSKKGGKSDADVKSGKKAAGKSGKKADGEADRKSGGKSDASAPAATVTTADATAATLFTPPLPHAVTADPEVAGDTATDPERDLTAMTLVQLRALAREAGLSGVSKATKAQLIEHLHAGATPGA